MGQTRDKKLERLEEDWRRRIENIGESAFSPRQCRRIQDEFTLEFKSTIADVSVDFSEAERLLKSLSGDLTVALEQSKANYRDQLGSFLEKIKFDIEVKIFSFI